LFDILPSLAYRFSVSFLALGGVAAFFSCLCVFVAKILVDQRYP